MNASQDQSEHGSTTSTKKLTGHRRLEPVAAPFKPHAAGMAAGTAEKASHETDRSADDFRLFNQHDSVASKISQEVDLAGARLRSKANQPQRILVVDDDEDTRQLSIDVLAASGYDVEAVPDGVAGWEALQTNAHDLVITDNKMPRMTGIEMIEKLRSARMSLPVIMATRYLPAFEFARKPWLLPNATLQRPFSNDELLDAVKKILSPNGGDDGRRESTVSTLL